MSQDRLLFPHKLSRRELLNASAWTAGALVLGGSLFAERRYLKAADAAKKPVKIGSGRWTYTLDETWGALPSGMSYGFGCAVVVDSQDKVYVTSRSTSPCVAVFDKDGKLLETWSKDFADNVRYSPDQVKATAHGLYWSREPEGEFFYFTENVDKQTGDGARVYKTDLAGKVLYELGKGVKASGNSQPFDFVNPTDVAVAPNGDIYIVDGYGSQLVHRFDKNFKLMKTIGGRGKEHGQFNVCHGVWVSTLGEEPEVYIADRANNRLEVYSLGLEYKRTVPEMKLPCCFYQHDGHLYIPELGARVSIIDATDQVVARLGDGAGIDKAKIGEHPDRFATPHALTLDSRGDLYVVEWLPNGRPRKFKHTPA